MVTLRRSTCFNDLPNDAVYNILKQLPAEDVCCMSVCSKDVFRLTLNDDLWFIVLKRKWGKYIPGLQQVWISHTCDYGESLRKGLLIPDWAEVQVSKECSCPMEESSLSNHNKKAKHSASSKNCSCPALPFSIPVNYPKFATHKAHSVSSKELLSYFESGQVEFPVQIINCELYLDCLLSAYDGKARVKGKVRQNGALKDIYEVTYDDSMDELSMDESVVQKESVTGERIRPSPLPILPRQTYGGCDIRHLNVGDFVEVQWRASSDLPFTWFFGQVRHFLFCSKSTSLDDAVPPCRDCVCNQMRRVCVTFRKFGYDYVERSLFVDKETPSLYRQVQSVGFTGSGVFGGVRKVQSSSEAQVWLKCGKSFQSTEKQVPQ